MPILEAVRMALGAIRAQKLKSFFSLIGVLIGVTFLIAVVSIVQGMNVYMEEKFANALVGHNTFTLRQRPNFVGGNVTDDVWMEWLRRPRITYDDADYVTDRIQTPVTVAKYCIGPDGADLRHQAGERHRPDGNRAELLPHQGISNLPRGPDLHPPGGPRRAAGGRAGLAGCGQAVRRAPSHSARKCASPACRTG